MPTSQPVELRRIDRADRPAPDRLLDAHLSELGTYREFPVGPTDAATYPYLSLYWQEPGRHPFVVVAEGARAGFVWIREIEKESITEVSEFYIRPAFRRCGLGRASLAEVWRRFSGAWRVEVHPRNAAAAAFWLSCVEEFASGDIEVNEVAYEDGQRLQYRFEIA